MTEREKIDAMIAVVDNHRVAHENKEREAQNRLVDATEQSKISYWGTIYDGAKYMRHVYERLSLELRQIAEAE